MSRAVGVKKPHEAQKASALSKMKAAKEAGEEYYDPTCEDNIQGRNRTRLAPWEEHLRDPIVALDKALKCVDNSYLGSRPGCLVEGVSCNGWRWFPTQFVGKADLLDPMDSVCLRTASMSGMCQGSTGRTASSFSSWLRRSWRRCRTVRPSALSSMLTSARPGTPGSSALPNPLPKSPCVGEECRRGLGQALPAGSPIVGSRVQMILRLTCIRLGRRAALPRPPTNLGKWSRKGLT